MYDLNNIVNELLIKYNLSSEIDLYRKIVGMYSQQVINEICESKHIKKEDFKVNEYVQKYRSMFSKTINGIQAPKLYDLEILERLSGQNLSYILYGEKKKQIKKDEDYITFNDICYNDSPELLKEFNNSFDITTTLHLTNEYEEYLFDLIIKHRSVKVLCYLINEHGLRFDCYKGFIINDPANLFGHNDYLKKFVEILISKNKIEECYKLLNPYSRLNITIESDHPIYIFNDETILKEIAKSTALILKLCEIKEVEFSSINGRLNEEYPNVYITSCYTTKLFEYLLKDIKANSDKISYMLKACSANIEKVYNSLLCFSFKGKDIDISDTGLVSSNPFNYGSILYVTTEHINGLTNEANNNLSNIYNYITLIKQLNNRNDISNKGYSIVDGNILKLRVTNKAERSLYNLAKDNNITVIPNIIKEDDSYTYLSTLDPVIYHRYKLSDEQIKSIIKFLGEFNKLSMEKCGKVYCHNNLLPDDFIFDNDQLIEIRRWDNTTLENKPVDLYEILVFVLYQYAFFDNNGAIIKYILSLIDSYQAEGLKKNLADGLIKLVNDKLEALAPNINDSNNIYKYYMYIKILGFINLNKAKLNSL